MKTIEGHRCPGWVIAEPHGAVGVIDTPLTTQECLWVEQVLTKPIPPSVEAIYAELVIDDAVIGTSFAGEIDDLPPGRPDHGLHFIRFQFPPLAAPVQHYGIRYVVRTPEGMRRVDMSPSC